MACARLLHNGFPLNAPYSFRLFSSFSHDTNLCNRTHGLFQQAPNTLAHIISQTIHLVIPTKQLLPNHTHTFKMKGFAVIAAVAGIAMAHGGPEAWGTGKPEAWGTGKVSAMQLLAR